MSNVHSKFLPAYTKDWILYDTNSVLVKDLPKTILNYIRYMYIADHASDELFSDTPFNCKKAL